MAHNLNQDPLFQFLPDWLLQDVTMEIRVPDRLCRCCSRMEERIDRRPSLLAPAVLVKIGGNPDDHTIVLHPDYYKPGTASGEALRAHELFHVWQRSVVPDFDRVFTQEAIRIEAAGLQPWDNGFERPAYEFERQVKARLLEQGFPLRHALGLRGF